MSNKPILTYTLKNHEGIDRLVKKVITVTWFLVPYYFTEFFRSHSIKIIGFELTTMTLEHLLCIGFTWCHLNEFNALKFFMIYSTYCFATVRHLRFHIFICDGAKEIFCLTVFRFVQLIKYTQNIQSQSIL